MVEAAFSFDSGSPADAGEDTGGVGSDSARARRAEAEAETPRRVVARSWLIQWWSRLGISRKRLRSTRAVDQSRPRVVVLLVGENRRVAPHAAAYPPAAGLAAGEAEWCLAVTHRPVSVPVYASVLCDIDHTRLL
jgi:hypothetical protein